MDSTTLKETRYIPISKWPHEWPPHGTFRHLIFNSKNNGFDRAIKRVGRRILIDEKAFFDWVSEQN